MLQKYYASSKEANCEGIAAVRRQVCLGSAGQRSRSLLGQSSLPRARTLKQEFTRTAGRLSGLTAVQVVGWRTTVYPCSTLGLAKKFCESKFTCSKMKVEAILMFSAMNMMTSQHQLLMFSFFLWFYRIQFNFVAYDFQIQVNVVMFTVCLISTHNLFQLPLLQDVDYLFNKVSDVYVSRG